MSTQGDKVLKKDISNGIREGVVLKVWLRSLPTASLKPSGKGIEYVRVKWTHGITSNCKASAVLPHTPENMELLEQKRFKHYEKWIASLPDEKKQA